MRVDPKIYDEDYYERGLESGKSCYQNYRWMPELTIPMAMTILEFVGIRRDQTVLDFGCAKGFLVKALRLLHRKTWGVDISQYAISQVPEDTRAVCQLVGSPYKGFPQSFDICIAKDVFEHVPEEEIRQTIRSIPAIQMFAVIPLGDNGTYRAKANNYDITHVLCKDETWWLNTFKECGWDFNWFGHRIDGIKDSYYKPCPKGHGFFLLNR